MLKIFYGKEGIYSEDLDPELPDQEILYWEEEN